jgi:acetyl esterase/lipase
VSAPRALLALAVLAAAGCTPLALGTLNLPARFGDHERAADVAYGGAERHRLDIYTPAAAHRPAPVVVFFHGGHWRSGDKGRYRFAADALTALGYAVVVPNYRLWPEAGFPDFVADGAAAVAWVHAHVGDYGGDPDRLFLMGHSAGAHIAALLALDPAYLEAAGGDESWIDGMIGLAGPYERLSEDVFGPPSAQAAARPVNFVHPGQPPLLLLHGRDDETVPVRNSVSLATAAREAGGRTEFYVYDGIGHVGILTALAWPFRSRAPVVDEVDRFMRGRLAGSGP